jgi:5-formyltetrahydrofolate cyclo-ligase
MQQAKIALRKKMRDILKDVPLKQQEDQTKVVVQKLFAMEQYQKAQRISIYCSMPGEIQTDDIIKDIFNKG